MKVLLPLLVIAVIISSSAAALLGGLRTMSNTDPMAVKAADIARQHIKDMTNGIAQVQVISTQYQVIAGYRYVLNLKVTLGNQEKHCSIEVISNPMREYSVTPGNSNGDCTVALAEEQPQVRTQRSTRLLGGKEELDLTEQGVQEAANWAVDHINGMSNALYRQALERIADGSKQVVNGYKYRFLLYLVSTTCRNNQKNVGKSLVECPADDEPRREQCDVTVISSSGKYSMPDFKCKTLKVENMIGGDDHDYQNHGNVKPLLGGDGHDYQNHGKVRNLLGGDDHDYQNHLKVKTLLGGDDHDYQNHEKVKSILGGDDHDYQNHGKVKTLLGGDDHDYKPHGRQHLLGQDFHDMIPHLKSNLEGVMNTAGKEMKEKLLDRKDEIIQQVIQMRRSHILGGDTHDYLHHGNDPCLQHRAAFEEFKSKHGRLYASPEVETEKFQIFCGNMEKVKEYQKMEMGSAHYGATKFADISESEFKATYLGWNVANDKPLREWPQAEIPKGPIPEAWDWRDHNAVTPVKNQGSCGSCWAFSTTGNIEGKNAIKHKKLVSFSEQELLDCDTIDLACAGGLPTQAYEAIMEIGGLETEQEYGYDAAKEKCKFKKSEVAVKLTGAVNISKDEGEMAAWLYKNGPISIGINAFAMQFYLGGIAHPWKIFCNPKNLDHGVLIVGYGMEGSEPYWIVKNSWGANWGREGYYYVYRGDGVCGLNTMCTSAIVE